ncbi:MAG: hypothetical protein JJE49_01615 [Peptostreptococcaceae bacterium]|nr:hypothetical protein [Peptostreptococcaceae bacterium]
MLDEASRKKILTEFGAKNEDMVQLLEYNRNVFKKVRESEKSTIELYKDEAFAEVWQGYLNESKEVGVFEVLKKYFPQLNFPIEAPMQLKLYLHSSLSGRIPILYTSCRPDFETLSRVLSMKNEPLEIPDSTGAFFIKGYNNWNRIKAQGIIPQKHLYQDKLIILSGGFYSNISSEVMGLSDEEWEKLSFIIRREHECTHYFTQRIYGFARNNLLDELIADFMGIVEAKGEFCAAWLLKFMGLEGYPKYRKGGRLENYISKSFNSEEASVVMQRLVWQAAHNLEKLNISLSINNSRAAKLDVLSRLCNMTLEEIAVF